MNGPLDPARVVPPAHPDDSAGARSTRRLAARLLAISPCRNEAAYLRASVASVVAQSRRPDRWIIVDDGSSDETPAILAELAAQHPFIEVHRIRDRGFRHVGPGVVHAFQAGVQQVGDIGHFDFLCKLDLDLILPTRYFEALLERMQADPQLGTCSGKALVQRRGQLVAEGQGDDVSLGMAKLYRRVCYEQIGGLTAAVMWDGIDCHRARMLGWQARSWSHPDVDFVHLRPMGSSHRGTLAGRFRHGRGQYFMGTAFSYMLISALNWTRRPPLLLGGLAMLSGWIWGALRREARYGDDAFRRFLRRYHRRVLVRGKHRAMEEVLGQRP